MNTEHKKTFTGISLRLKQQHASRRVESFIPNTESAAALQLWSLYDILELNIIDGILPAQLINHYNNNDTITTHG